MRKFLVGASAAAALALIAGCGSSGSDDTMAGHGAATTGTSIATGAPSSAAESAHNADDVSFAQQMIPHHAQAVEMANLVPSRGAQPEVFDLASRIQKAQDPEIQQLTAMLTKWGSAPTSAPSMPGMDHGAHGSTGSGGMMTAEEMDQLVAAKGAEFDRMWMQMMIKHHEGAVDMARTELSKGSSSDAKALAQKIIDAQQAEITEMQGLLK
jgi:uncharacterized protein (DUF305 family)